MAYKNVEDSRAYQRRWYHRNKAKRKDSRSKNRVRIAKWYDEYRLNVRCCRCGENHPACIVFHHRNERTKSFEVSVGVADALSISRILKEIAKCDVLCVNCHLLAHAAKRSRSRAPVPPRKNGRSMYGVDS